MYCFAIKCSSVWLKHSYVVSVYLSSTSLDIQPCNYKEPSGGCMTCIVVLTPTLPLCTHPPPPSWSRSGYPVVSSLTLMPSGRYWSVDRGSTRRERQRGGGTEMNRELHVLDCVIQNDCALLD